MSTEYTSEYTSAGQVAERLLKAKDAAARIIREGVKRGIVAETTVLSGWTQRYKQLSVSEQTALATPGSIPTPAAYVAALRVAGATPNEQTIAEAFMADVRKDLPSHVQEIATPAAYVRPALIDTPETREAAMQSMGITI